MNNMLSLEEVRNLLDVEQQVVESYLKGGRLRAYKIGGTYLRFRKEEVLNLKSELLQKKRKNVRQVSILSHLGDFWRFNNFYIVSLLLVLVLALFAIRF